MGDREKGLIMIRGSCFRQFSGIVSLLLLAVASPRAAEVMQQARIAASNAEIMDRFGEVIAISGDTMVVGAAYEASGASGVNGDQQDNSAALAGAAYVYVRDGASWRQQAYLKASTPGYKVFGWSVAISDDIIVVGAPSERSNATGVNGDETDGSLPYAGAAYVFVRHGTNWTQEAYLKASNTDREQQFGRAVAVSGNTVVVAAPMESSGGEGSGAVYVFVRTGATWSQQAYLKAPNVESNDVFGISLAISGDTIVVGASGDDSGASGVNGDQHDNSAEFAGAAHVFVRSGSTWTHQAYLKASNAGRYDSFGSAAAISGDTIVIGAWGEYSNATGVNGNQNDDSLGTAGAAYVFVRNGTSWAQQAYLKASNTDAWDFFGQAVAVSGNVIVVGAPSEQSNATGVNGNQADNSSVGAGAAYVFVREGTDWAQVAYLKPWNADSDARFPINYVFGGAVAASADVVAAGAYGARNHTGAVYTFGLSGVAPADGDGDGVSDEQDQCPGTGQGEIVDAKGCTIEQLVPCRGPWRNHGDYLRALKKTTSDFVAAGLINGAQQRVILRAGAQSNCGKPRSQVVRPAPSVREPVLRVGGR
jgi:trimeric autotransporter adhesin